MFAGDRFESFREARDMACLPQLPTNTTRIAELTEQHNIHQMTVRGVWTPNNTGPPRDTFLIGLKQTNYSKDTSRT